MSVDENSIEGEAVTANHEDSEESLTPDGPEQPVIFEGSVATESVQSAPLALSKVIVVAILATAFIASIVFNAVTLLEDSTETSGDSFGWLVTTSALLITAISLGVSFWLYYVRSVLLKDGPALVPEKWGVYLAKLGHVISDSNSRTIESLSALASASAHQTEKAETVLDSFLTLQQAISSRDDEIKRLKKGQDAKVYKRFLARFIRVSTVLEEIKKECAGSEQEKNYKILCRLMEAALEECGLELWRPEVGSDYRELGEEVADDPRHVSTDDPSLEFKIESIDSPAYIVEGQGDREIIVQAKVTIFQLEAQIEEGN